MANIIQFEIIGNDRFSKNLGKAANTIKKVGKVAVGVGTAYIAASKAVDLFTESVANAIDPIAKFSHRIGISVDQLSKMQFVAGQAGLSATQFNLSVQRMTRRVAEAGVGLGEAQGALKELGINANEFKNLKLEDQFFLLAEKMKDVKSDSDQLRLAFKLFDSEGTAVLQMLKGGREAMEAYAKQAEKFGVVIDKRTAFVTEQYTDSLGNLSAAFKGVKIAIASELMPVLTDANNKFADSVAKWRKDIKTFVKNSIFEILVLAEIISQFGSHIWGLVTFSEQAWKSLFDGVAGFVINVGKLFFLLGKTLFISFKSMFSIVGDMFVAFGKWIAAWLKSIFTRKDIESFSKTMSEAFSKAVEASRKTLQKDADDIKKDFNEVFTAGDKAVEQTFGINIQKARDNVKKYMDELVKFNEESNKKMTESGKNAVEKQTEMMNAFSEFVNELRFTMEDFLLSMMDLTLSVVQQVGDAVAASIVDGQKLSEALKNITKGVLKTLISMLVQWMVKRFILSKLFHATTTTETAQQGAKAVGLAGANATASMAAAPWPISMGAPAFGAAMQAVAASQLASGIGIGAAIGASVVGVAHDGMTDIPREGTYLLDGGERVVSATQNRDLSEFLKNNNQSNSITIENINISILENATNADALLRMSQTEMDELVANRIITSLNRLDARGVRPVSVERKRF